MNNCPDCAEREDELAIQQELLENTYNKGRQDAINEVREWLKPFIEFNDNGKFLYLYDEKFKVTNVNVNLSFILQRNSKTTGKKSNSLTDYKMKSLN